MTKPKKRTTRPKAAKTRQMTLPMEDEEPRLGDLPAEDQQPPEEENPAIDQLIEIGRERGYVTIDDILAFFPDAECGAGARGLFKNLSTSSNSNRKSARLSARRTVPLHDPAD